MQVEGELTSYPETPRKPLQLLRVGEQVAVSQFLSFHARLALGTNSLCVENEDQCKCHGYIFCCKYITIHIP